MERLYGFCGQDVLDNLKKRAAGSIFGSLSLFGGYSGFTIMEGLTTDIKKLNTLWSSIKAIDNCY